MSPRKVAFCAALPLLACLSSSSADSKCEFRSREPAKTVFRAQAPTILSAGLLAATATDVQPVVYSEHSSVNHYGSQRASLLARIRAYLEYQTHCFRTRNIQQCRALFLDSYYDRIEPQHSYYHGYFPTSWRKFPDESHSHAANGNEEDASGAHEMYDSSLTNPPPAPSAEPAAWNSSDFQLPAVR